MLSKSDRVVLDGTYSTAVRKDQGFSSFAAGERTSEQPGSAQRDPLCGRAGVQVARASRPFRQLAHDLCADESLGQERRARPGLREVTTGTDRAHQDRGV